MMGVDARAVGRLSLGEFAVQMAGWMEANCAPAKPRAPSREAHETADWNW